MKPKFRVIGVTAKEKSGSKGIMEKQLAIAES